MSAQTIYSLTSGRTEGTFEDVVASIQNYGFRQSVFEVERISEAATGKATAGEAIVLWPSSIQEHYAEMKPKDRVYCTGLRKNDAGLPALCRILRMAEGTSRNTMTERK